MHPRRASDPQFAHWTIDGPALRLLISRRGFTAASLAIRVGMNRRNIGKLLSGERTGAMYPTAEAIAGALDCDIRLFADPLWTTSMRNAK